MINKERIRHRTSQVSATIRSWDFFKQPIPGFNIEGKVDAGTLLGSLISVCLILLMLLYGTFKFDILVHRLNPTITVVEKPKEFNDEMTLVNLRNETSMRFAFSVLSVDEKETRLDPRYVKMITRVYTQEADGNKSEQIIGHHACTDDDWAQFYPPSEAASS